MATYTKLYTLDLTDGGNTVYQAIDKLEDNIDSIITNLNLAHTTTAGDMIYRGASATARLAIGTVNKVLKSSGTAPAWAFEYNVLVAVASAVLTDTNDVVLANATSSNMTITLPTAVGRSGKRFIIKRTDTTSNTLNVLTDSDERIDGSTSFSLAAQYDVINMVSNSSGWYLLSPWNLNVST